MRQAIQTKYLGPTAQRGARIRASAQVGSVVVSYDHALPDEDNHKRAAYALAHKWGWSGKWYGGADADGTGYAFVRVEGTPNFEIEG